MSAIADFSTYKVISPIRRALGDDTQVTVHWLDGRTSPYHLLWLRDNCPCPRCVYPVTREQVVEIVDIPEDLQAAEVTLTGDGNLAILWQDGHASTYDAGWLRAHAYDEASLAERERLKPRKKLWDSSLAVPSFHYAEIMADEAALLAWLLDVRDTGLSLLHGVPVETGALAAVAQRISFIRETNFGTLFDVQSKAEADSNAYTAFNLPLHTDLPTRELQPGLQFLHCLVNEATGGSSTFVDGFKLAEVLKEEDPPSFEILTTIPIEFRNRGRSSDYRYRAPIIALDENDEVTEIRMANFPRGPFSTAPDTMPHLYRAYRRFIALTRDDRFRYRHRLAAGQLWCFDNRRALHARDEFDPSSGARHFQGCYVDRDELHSRIRVLQR